MYGQTTEENILKIQTLQNRLLRVLAKKNYMYSTNKLHNELKILKVEDLVIQEILTFVSNFKNNRLPNVFQNYFKWRQARQHIQTRNIENHMLTLAPRLNYGSRTVKSKGPKLWNQLPTSLSTLTSTKSFRAKWKEGELPYPN